MGVHLKDVSQSFWTAPLNYMKKWKFPSIRKHLERPQQHHSSRYSFRNDKHWSLFILAACALRCGSHHLCTYSTAGGHLGSFCFLAIVVSATKNVILTIFWLLLAWFLLGSCLYSALVRTTISQSDYINSHSCQQSMKHTLLKTSEFSVTWNFTVWCVLLFLCGVI